ncbi:3'-5' exoribonuclease [Grimontia marina]|uniref:3'-5' exoribonuclease/MT2234.1 n=1 Tax=Grimontia marina TaxID=646534 RepID=A0A128FKF4_9GAMM|nr:3'-5' exoribonuclease [Grimontia marina]CZF87050.1 3'-5' exoribonuclease/MT2234.1 [Grimontia marina]
MNIFIDTEFTDLPGEGSHSELIAIGIYCEDGSTYYGCLSDFNHDHLSDFVKEHVLPLLPEGQSRVTYEEMSREVSAFLKDKEITSVWATYPTLEQLHNMYPSSTDIHAIYRDYADWDFKLLLKLLGSNPLSLPKKCENIALLISELEPENVPENLVEHDALQDAIWNFKVWEAASGKACT